MNTALGTGAMNEGVTMIKLGPKRPRSLLAFGFSFLATFALGLSVTLKERTHIAADVAFVSHFTWLADIGAVAAISAEDCSTSLSIQFLGVGHKIVCHSFHNGQNLTRAYFYSVLGQLSEIKQGEL